MATKFFSLVLLVVAGYTNAQSHLPIMGRVLDRKTGKPLSYANISIKNKTLGTVTNDAGEFEFFVSPDFKNDTLLVSYIGHKTFKSRISDLANAVTIYLEEAPTLLNEITISSEGARELVEKALQAIPQIYPDAPYLMEGFHRSWEKLDFTDSISYPGTLIEAAVTIYDPGYGQKRSGKGGKEEIYINEIRRSAINKGWNYNSSALRDLLNKNAVRYNHGPAWLFLKNFLAFPNNLDYEWEGETQMDNERLTIIKAEIPNDRKFPACYKIYVSHEDHAILRYDLFGEQKEIDYSIGPWHTEYLNISYVFKRYQKKIYLSHVRIDYTIKNLDSLKKKVLRTENYHRELLINNIITVNVAEKRKSLKAQKSKEVSLALQTGKYNENFWKTYNVILENPLDKEIIRYFE